MVRIVGSHPTDPGSTPGRGILFFLGFDLVLQKYRRLQTAPAAHTPQSRLAQLVERKTLNLVVVGSSPTVGVSFV